MRPCGGGCQLEPVAPAQEVFAGACRFLPSRQDPPLHKSVQTRVEREHVLVHEPVGGFRGAGAGAHPCLQLGRHLIVRHAGEARVLCFQYHVDDRPVLRREPR
ncbi:hypothetical protein DFR74_106174 [Nocardia puris]|uniref:Uncharacterized protein n=1 Tax=Nocardia puris TaxID=208602 RepID=A0A366DLC7_9NOCA|nr:hypothetical protein DFR74_106174 [Nocardia puris]